ncbi:adrenoceptor alpha 1Aa [Sardina pilchardus]|uniref:adrenoceptor alpha 1Aa n=1 Tax=Sardina pilchardus TaxID=27697 RepID=UPI002E151FA3
MPEPSEQMVVLGGSVTPHPPLQSNCSNCSLQGAPSSSSSSSPPPELDLTKAVALGVVLAVFIVFGVLGNILVILSVACHRRMRTVTHVFIVNLAAADLLLSSLVLPFSAVFEVLGRWVFGRLLCDVWAALDVLCCTASIMSLCVISVDRYIGVSFPLRYPALVTRRRALLALLGVWSLSVTISVGPLFGWKEPAPEDESVCRITEEPAYAIFSAAGSFYLPLVVILVMYCRVYVVARRETLVLRRGRKTERLERDAAECVTLRVHRGNAAAAAAASEEDEALRRRTHFALRLLKFSREKRAAKTLGIVVGCFILCWLPFFLVLPISSIFPAYRPSDTVFKITFWLGYFNSCINPLIYPCSSQEFKKAFLSLLGVACLKRRTHTHTHPHTHTHQAQAQASPHTHTHPHHSTLSLATPRLSATSSLALSRTPSSRDGADWSVACGEAGGGGGGGGATGVKAAGLCSKSLLRTCCCVGTHTHTHTDTHTQTQRAEATHTPAKNALPVIKIHKLSLCENGDAV